MINRLMFKGPAPGTIIRYTAIPGAPPPNAQALLADLLSGEASRYPTGRQLPQRPALHRCAYCRSLIDTLRCPNCGAPVQ